MLQRRGSQPSVPAHPIVIGGISVAPPSAQYQWIKIKDLTLPSMSKLYLQFIIVEKGEVIQNSKGDRICKTLVADETASVFMTLWNEYIEDLQDGDIVRLYNGYCVLFQDELTLYVGKEGRIEKIGEFEMLFTEVPNMSWKRVQASTVSP